jgi:integrase
MARRRFQAGGLTLKNGLWIGRWREDEYRDGKLIRVRRYEVLGTQKEFATSKLARRELQKRVSIVNDLSYRAKTAASFQQFAQRWMDTVMCQTKPSTRSTFSSHVKKYFLPAFGTLRMSDIRTESVQCFIAGLKLSPKTVRNIHITLQLMWKSAKAWEYVSHSLDGIVLPKARRSRRPSFTLDEMRRIIAAAQNPQKMFYWLAAETGLRAGELCGLRVDDIDFDRGIVKVWQSAWHGKLQDPKSENSIRTFAISTSLRNCLKTFLANWRPNAQHLLFASRNGTPWDANLLVKRKLRPLLESLGIAGGGLHGFRHGNASLMDILSTPMKVRQQRLGHSDPRLTMNVYTHAASADDEKIAEQLGDLLGQLDASWPQQVISEKEKGPALQQALVN